MEKTGSVSYEQLFKDETNSKIDINPSESLKKGEVRICYQCGNVNLIRTGSVILVAAVEPVQGVADVHKTTG